MLELRYMRPGGGDLAMIVVLPRERDGLAAAEARLRSGGMWEWFEGLTPARVSVILPKFCIDPAEALDLSDALAGLGMSRAFDPRRADFTGIADPPDPGERLSISKVCHKAFVKVDEAGTEAAAATAVIMWVGTGEPQETVEFRADHPFLFFLRDRSSGMILFVGRIDDPR